MTSESDVPLPEALAVEVALGWEVSDDVIAAVEVADDVNDVEAPVLEGGAAPRGSPHPGKARAAIPRADAPVKLINDLLVSIM